MYVIFFIGIWSVYSISNGIASYCYFTNANPRGKGNTAIYEECFKELGSSGKALIVLFNVKDFYEF